MLIDLSVKSVKSSGCYYVTENRLIKFKWISHHIMETARVTETIITMSFKHLEEPTESLKLFHLLSFDSVLTSDPKMYVTQSPLKRRICC